MTEQEFNQAVKNGQADFIQPEPKQEEIKPLTLDEYQPVLEAIRRPRTHLTSAPAFTPKTLIDSIQYYDDGVDRRLYLYINGNWRYVALT